MAAAAAAAAAAVEGVEGLGTAGVGIVGVACTNWPTNLDAAVAECDEKASAADAVREGE